MEISQYLDVTIFLLMILFEIKKNAKSYPEITHKIENQQNQILKKKSVCKQTMKKSFLFHIIQV